MPETMPPAPLAFTVREVRALHVVVDGSGYWEGYRGAAAPARFHFAPGWRTVYATRMEAALFRVVLDDGTVGWGEANAPIVPEVTCLVATRLLGPILAGRDFDHPQTMWDFLYDSQRGRGHQSGFHLDAMAGVDIAVWDALGKRAGLPLAALLSDRPRTTIPVYLSGIRRPSLEERIAHARGWAERGLSGAKLFLDADLEAGTRELAALQEAVPGIGRWMVDLLWSCPDLDAAARAKAAYGELGTEWLECPLLPEDLDGHRRLRPMSGAPIALGEHLHTTHDALAWLEAGALDVYQPDVGRTGISDAQRQVALAKARGIPSTPHMGSGLDIFQAATLHFAAACGPDLLTEYQAALAGRLEGAVTSAWAFADGAFHLPDRPGLGIEVDETALARFLAPAAWSAP
jgi:D-galactarolactone cycloisomerase